jgi:hypothetical protein
MDNRYLPKIDLETLQKIRSSNNPLEYFDLLVQPLHEELYKRQSFDFFEELSKGQQLLLSYDYIQNQVLQGGFIQLIENGYIGLLPDMPDWLTMVGDTEMAKVIDDVLKVYVLNKEVFDRATSIEDFVKLYEELREFEIIDDRFRALNEPTIKLMLTYADSHLDEFISIN